MKTFNEDFQQPSLYFLPPLTARVPHQYAELARSLPYRIEALDTSNKFMPRLHEIAEFCSGYINVRQPQGDIELVGWSFGATLAVACARLLEKNGRKVSRIYSIDAAPPCTWRQSTVCDRVLSLINKIAEIYHEKIIVKPSDLPKNIYDQPPHTQIKIIDSVTKDICDNNSSTTFYHRHLRLCLRQMLAQYDLVLEEKTEPLDLELISIEATQKIENLTEGCDFTKWARYAKRVRHVSIQGDHWTLFSNSELPIIISQCREAGGIALQMPAKAGPLLPLPITWKFSQVLTTVEDQIIGTLPSHIHNEYCIASVSSITSTEKWRTINTFNTQPTHSTLAGNTLFFTGRDELLKKQYTYISAIDISTGIRRSHCQLDTVSPVCDFQVSSNGLLAIAITGDELMYVLDMSNPDKISIQSVVNCSKLTHGKMLMSCALGWGGISIEGKNLLFAIAGQITCCTLTGDLVFEMSFDGKFEITEGKLHFTQKGDRIIYDIQENKELQRVPQD